MLEPVAMADDWSLEVEAGAVASFWRLTSGAPLSECGMTAKLFSFRFEWPYTLGVEVWACIDFSWICCVVMFAVTVTLVFWW